LYITGASGLTNDRSEAKLPMTEPVFLVGLVIVATTAVMVAKAIAGAIGGRGASRSELAQMREQLEQHTAALQDAQTSLADQSSELAELHERLDFAERLLTQARDRSTLGPGEKPG
jgi:uncharacterized protein YycO